jgi:mitogen-activated protein kinase 1/3
MKEDERSHDAVKNVATPAKAGSPKKEKDKERDSRPSTATPPQLPEHLRIVRPLGKGAYGAVWLCDDVKSNEQVAVKHVRDFARDPLVGKRILREIRILSALKHQNLLKLIDLLPPPSADFDDVFIVMPYVEYALDKVIYSSMVRLSDSHAQAFACQILRGLKYLHSAGVVHRDLKPANILVNKDCTLRIADLGLARGRTSEEEELTEYVVTRWYRAPELMLLPQGYFAAVDLWSVGCIHSELLLRKPLFPGDNALDMLRRIVATLGFCPEKDLDWLPPTMPAGPREGVMSMVEAMQRDVIPQPLEGMLPSASKVCLDFIHKLLAFDHTKRISAEAALEHPYIDALRDPPAETVASRAYAWHFDCFEATPQALKDRVYVECTRLHPDIVARDAAQLAASGRSYLLADNLFDLFEAPAEPDMSARSLRSAVEARARNPAQERGQPPVDARVQEERVIDVATDKASTDSAKPAGSPPTAMPVGPPPAREPRRVRSGASK